MNERLLLVTDFDGTVTRNDFYRLVVEAHAPDSLAHYWGGYRSGRYTHFEALAGIFADVRATEADFLNLVARAEPEPRFGEYLASLRAAGWDVVVASAGCDWYIRRILAGHDVPIHANPGRIGDGGGLVMERPIDSAYYCETNGIDKAALVRQGLSEGRTVAFAGDGFPDAPAARLVPEELRFARADLAAMLSAEGLSYRPFERWGEVAEALLTLSAGPEAAGAEAGARPGLSGLPPAR
jgi:2-hydroxy-3-keto-5-methylthiopentenyl-1-phosphate phosphatase